jgi:hypothetical protein
VKPGEVAPAHVYLFRPEREPERSGAGLRVKLLMNLDIPTRRRARVPLWRYAPMISGLRVMSRHPALGEFAVVAFSLEEQDVLFRQEFSRRIRFPDLGDAIESLTPATVDVNDLRRGSDLEFLDDLLAKELSDTGRVDAIIFVGADDRFGKRVSPQTLEQIRAARIPVFHFNSTVFLWRGAIGNAVKSLGGKEYKVRQPHELAKAVESLVAEILARRPSARDENFSNQPSDNMCMAKMHGETQGERPCGEDPKTVAAIQRGILDADEGRVTPIEDVRKAVSKWIPKTKRLADLQQIGYR